VDYWGLNAIAQRMCWKNPRSPVQAHLREAFPMYPRRNGQHPRKVYYTNDQLINLWELAKAKEFRERLLARLEGRAS